MPAQLSRPGVRYSSALGELTRRIHDEFKYQPKSTSIDTPLLEVLHNRQGVCQDFAHLMIGDPSFPALVGALRERLHPQRPAISRSGGVTCLGVGVRS